MRLVLAATAEAAPIDEASWVLLSSTKERRQKQTTCCRVATIGKQWGENNEPYVSRPVLPSLCRSLMPEVKAARNPSRIEVGSIDKTAAAMSF